MSLFKKGKTTNTLPALESDVAAAIYELLKTKDANRIFLEDNIPTEYTEQVEGIISAFESEYVSKVSGSYMITAKIPATYDEAGEIVDEAIPAVMYELTTKTALLESISCELLDKATIASDVEDYYKEYKENRTFAEFKALVGGE